MSYLPQSDFDGDPAMSASIEGVFGFVPNLLRAQGLLLRIPGLWLVLPGRIVVDHHQAALSQPDAALLDLAIRLATRAPWVSARDIGVPREHAFNDEAILGAILAARQGVHVF